MLISNTFDWLVCPHAGLGPGVLGVGALIWFTVFIMMANWTEGFRMPIAWTMLFAPIIFAMVPGAIAARLMGVATIALAAALFMLWQLWNQR